MLGTFGDFPATGLETVKEVCFKIDAGVFDRNDALPAARYSAAG